MRSLSIILQDIEISASDRDLTGTDLQDLQQVAGGCHDVLLELSELVEKNWSLDESPSGSRNIAKRAWARANWSPELAHSLQGRISASVTLLNAFQARITRETTASLLRHVEDQECQRMLEWLSPAQYSLEHSDLISKRHPNTGQWLLDSPGFQRWLKTQGTTFFCPGIPGAGKTILAASVVDYFLTHTRLEDGIGVAYIYLNFRRQEDQKLPHLIASLVKHLAQQNTSAIQSLKTLYDAHVKNKTRPSINELNELLNAIVHSPSFERIFIIVDALDECQAAENCRLKFTCVLSRLVQAGKANVFATSRPSPELQNALQQSSTISLELRATDEDVQVYLEGNFENLPNCIKSSSVLQDQIKSTIAKAADGMFLLARLYLSQLDDKTTIKDVKKALRYFEAQGKKAGVSEAANLEILSQAYDQTMERIQMQRPGFRLLAEKALLWIVSARRPLKVMELLQALGIDEDELVFDDDNIPQLEDVVSACAGLVIVDKDSEVVRLVHYTTQEYFEQRRDSWLPDAEWRISRACILYLFTWGNRPWPTIDCHDDDLARDEPAYQLRSYAAKHWGEHLASAPTHCQRSSIVIEFLQSSKSLDICTTPLLWGTEGFAWPEHPPGGRHALHFAAHFGLVETIKAILDKDKRPESVNVGDPTNRTPIWYAIRSGKEDTLRELVGRGATVSLNLPCEYGTPLAVAAYGGQDRLVKFLVENGAGVNNSFCGTFFTQYPANALLVAAEEGHTETVKVLLACGADLEFENKEGEGALFCAAESGHVEVVQCLINSGADVNARNRELTTPLIKACEFGRLDVVRLLLLNGAELEVVDMRGETALRAATATGVEAVVLALINAGAEIDAREMWFDTPLKTPLWIACRAGYAHLAKLFLSRGAHVEAYRKFIHRYARYRDPFVSDLTPLQIAADRGHTSVVALLLEYNADKEATNAKWQTPLMLAAEGRHYDVVRLLLHAGADFHGLDIEGKNAATVIWQQYSYDKRFLPPELTEQHTANLSGLLFKVVTEDRARRIQTVASQHEILQFFASQGAKLITFTSEEIGRERWDEWWEEYDGEYWDMPPCRSIAIESSLQLRMLEA